MGYARILKDKNGKPSGYRECDGEVAYMPERRSYENIFRHVKIDLDTMEIMDHDFIKDKNHVYRKGVLLRGITYGGEIKMIPNFELDHALLPACDRYRGNRSNI